MHTDFLTFYQSTKNFLMQLLIFCSVQLRESDGDDSSYNNESHYITYWKNELLFIGVENHSALVRKALQICWNKTNGHSL